MSGPKPAPAAQTRARRSAMTPGSWVSMAAAALASFLWLRLRPDSPVGGAGGAVIPVLVVIIIIYFAMAWLGPALDEKWFMKARARRLRLEREGTPFLRELRKNTKRARRRLDNDVIDGLTAAADALEAALDGDEEAVSDDVLEDARRKAEAASQQQLGRGRKSMFMDFMESIGGALAIALVLRLFVVEAFKIPSGSMIPTLAIGDHIFVNKFIYGISLPLPGKPRKTLTFVDPKPGEVVVFVAPKPARNAGEDFIKRVIAVSGQKIRLEDGVLYVDDKPYQRLGGEPLEYEDQGEYGSYSRRSASLYQEAVGDTVHSVLYEASGERDWPTPNTHLNGMDCQDDGCTLQPGYIFCMGDNRDNSEDSRRWGAVPIESVKGRAMFVWLSVKYGPDGGVEGIRWDRLGKGIH